MSDTDLADAETIAELRAELLALPPQLRGEIEAKCAVLMRIPPLNSGQLTYYDVNLVRITIGQHLVRGITEGDE